MPLSRSAKATSWTAALRSSTAMPSRRADSVTRLASVQSKTVGQSRSASSTLGDIVPTRSPPA
eukprot:7158587-Prymnesium_polylepis.1